MMPTIGAELVNAGVAAIDFPASLGSQGWWRRDHVTVVGSAISACTDLSTYGRDEAQALGLLRPDLVTESGVPYGSFGGGSVLTIPSSFAVAMGASEFTMWSVFRTDDASAKQVIFSVGPPGSDGYAMAIGEESAGFFEIFVRGIGALKGPAATADMTLLVAMLHANTWRLFVNATRVALADSGVLPAAATGSSFAGALGPLGTDGFTGIIGEEGGVARALTGDNGIGSQVTGELLGLWTYAQGRYGIT